MGFQNKTRGTYFTILDGKFSVKVDEGTEGAVTRENKEGNIVHEVYHDSFEGFLTKIDTKDGNYGKSWIFTFCDDLGEFYNLQLNYSNSFAVAFLKMLPNIDLSKKMELTPSSKMVDGKKVNSLFVKQGGVNIKHAYTRENPNGMPDLEQKIVKGQKVWDDTDRLIFLENMVRETILPRLNQNITPDTTAPTPETDTLNTEPEEDEDQPF